jgi:hypothetical protein
MIISLETITLESTQLFTLLGLRLVTQTHQANTHIYYLIYLLKSFPQTRNAHYTDTARTSKGLRRNKDKYLQAILGGHFDPISSLSGVILSHFSEARKSAFLKKGCFSGLKACSSKKPHKTLRD